jgi:hypothetical protein
VRRAASFSSLRSRCLIIAGGTNLPDGTCIAYDVIQMYLATRDDGHLATEAKPRDSRHRPAGLGKGIHLSGGG